MLNTRLYLQTALLLVPLMSWERWFKNRPSALSMEKGYLRRKVQKTCRLVIGKMEVQLPYDPSCLSVGRLVGFGLLRAESYILSEHLLVYVFTFVIEVVLLLVRVCS